MTPKWITAVLAICLSGAVLSAPTSTTDNLIVKRASVNDVSGSFLHPLQFHILRKLTRCSRETGCDWLRQPEWRHHWRCWWHNHHCLLLRRIHSCRLWRRQEGCVCERHYHQDRQPGQGGQQHQHHWQRQERQAGELWHVGSPGYRSHQVAFMLILFSVLSRRRRMLSSVTWVSPRFWLPTAMPSAFVSFPHVAQYHKVLALNAVRILQQCLGGPLRRVLRQGSRQGLL